MTHSSKNWLRVLVLLFLMPTAAVLWLNLTGSASVVEAQQLPPEVVAYADLIVYNGQVLTVDPAFSTAEALAVRDGKFLAVGTTARIRAMAGPKTRQVDLQGRSVVPGFIDTHNHFHNFAERGLLPRVIFKTRDQWVAEIKKLVDAAEPGEWIVLRSERSVDQPYAQSVMAMGRKDLDPVSPKNPIFVWTSPAGNDAVINSEALRIAAMPPDISGMERDPKTGEPTGFIDAEAYGRLYYEVIPWPSIEKLLPLYKAANKIYNAEGRTTTAGRFPAYVISAFKILWERGELTQRFRIIHEFARNAYRPEAIIKRVGNLSGFGDGWLKISSANVGNPDGALGSGRGWTRKPKLPGLSHAKEEGSPDYGFVPHFEDHQASDWKTIPILNRYGWRILGIHTAGDASIDALFSAYEEANKEKPVAQLRHAFDHSEMVRPEHIATAKRLGLLASAEDVLGEASGNETLSKLYGADEVFGLSPIKSMLDAGLIVGLESNTLSPDDTGEQRTPLWTIEKFVTRIDTKGKVWNEKERVTRKQGLQMATIWAANYTGDEKILGSIEPGKLADFVILDGDYMKVPEEKISELKPIMTVIDGKIVYEAGAK